MIDPYLWALRRSTLLKLPTFQQTKRFVEWVADAHSWYKHLSEGAEFWFHIDPNANLSVDGDPPIFNRITEEQRFHYNFRTSDQWAEQFGSWTYRAGNQDRRVWDGTRWTEVPRDLGGLAIVGPRMYSATFEAPYPEADPYFQDAKQGRHQLWGMLTAAMEFKERVEERRP